jgi:hypothetical protein
MRSPTRLRPALAFLMAAMTLHAPSAGAVTLFSTVPVAKEAKAAPDFLVGTTPVGFDVEGMLAMRPGDVADFALPNGKQYDVVLDRIDSHDNGDRSWIGHLASGTRDDLVIFTLGGNGTYGSLTVPEGNWRVMPGGGHDWLFDADASGISIDRSAETDVRVHPSQLSQSHAKADPVCPAISATPTPQTTIDVLFVTAPDWVTAIGAGNVDTRLNTLVSSVNTYYANSKIAINLRRVGKVNVSYPAASAQNGDPSCSSASPGPACDAGALDNITDNTGGFENVELLRRLYGADMVLLMRGPRSASAGGASISGIAWVGGYNTSPITGSYSVMYSLHGDSPVFDGKLMAHEMGHNMGNNHDPSNAQGSAVGATSYAYGYTRCGSSPGAACPGTAGFNNAGSGGFGTIMSYWQPVIPRFSNPNDTCSFNGSGTVACSASMAPTFNVTPDEVRTINCTRGGISQFRTAYVQDCSNLAQDSDGDGLPDCVERALGYSTTARDNNILGGTREQNFLFAMQQYRDFLAREAAAPGIGNGDPDGLNFWTSWLTDGNTKAAMIEQFFGSGEFQGLIAPVTRLYFAYFLRIPDYAGLSFWIGQARAGMPLDTISANFAASSEFQSRYGTLDNTQFVTLIYNNVLGRAPDAGGLSFWVGQLNGGTKTRGQVMTGFSESAEYQAGSANKVYVTMMYTGMLRRAPDAGGFDFWVGYKAAGNSGQALINGFLTGTEYRSRFLP